MHYSYQSITMEQVKSPSQVPPKPGVVVLQLWTMWALCQLPPPTQRKARRSQHKRCWNQPCCLASGRQNPLHHTGCGMIVCLIRGFPHSSNTWRCMCTLSRNSRCVLNKGKTHSVLEVHITSSKGGQVWSPNAGLKTQNTCQRKNTRTPPSPAHQGLLGFAGIFLYPFDTGPWTMRPSGLSCYLVDGDCNLLCQTLETHPLLLKLPETSIWTKNALFPPSLSWKKIGVGTRRHGSSLFSSVSPEVPSRISNWVPGQPSITTSLSLFSAVSGKGWSVKSAEAGKNRRALRAEYKRSQPTNPCISINTCSSKENHHIQLWQIVLFSNLK